MVAVSKYSIHTLKVIETPNGSVRHFLKKEDNGYAGFGEVYFSEVEYNAIKGWKKHREMLMNIVVPVGSIDFYLLDETQDADSDRRVVKVNLSEGNYQRLVIQPGIWVAFKGMGKNKNMLANFANIAHNPAESESLPLNDPKFYGII